MLGDIPKERIDLVLNLRKTYHVSVLSNTNPIHIHYLNDILFQKTQLYIDEVFDTIFYSHHLGLHKPDSKIYECVSEKLDKRPDQILFLDDNLDNIKSAQKVGFNVIHVQNGDIIKALDGYSEY